MSALEGMNYLAKRGRTLRREARELADDAKDLAEFADPAEDLFTASAHLIAPHAFQGRDAALLDSMLEAHGLRAVLCTLYTLADSRAGRGECEMDADLDRFMASDAEDRAWTGARNRIGDIALDAVVHVK